MEVNDITERVIGAAIEEHRHLGPGLLEGMYEECLCYELNQLGLAFQRQVHLHIANGYSVSSPRLSVSASKGKVD